MEVVQSPVFDGFDLQINCNWSLWYTAYLLLPYLFWIQLRTPTKIMSQAFPTIFELHT